MQWQATSGGPVLNRLFFVSHVMLGSEMAAIAFFHCDFAASAIREHPG